MKKPIVLLLIILILTAMSFYWWNQGLKALSPNDKTSKIFVVRTGSGVRVIANSLKKEGIIKDPIVFFLLVKKLGLDNKIEAGDFRLSPSMTAEEVAKNLTHGTLDIWITIPEGKRADEIADMLRDKIPSYDPSWRNLLNQNEGYLFPDTYLIPKDATINLILSQMKSNFNQKFSKLDTSSTKLTKEQIVNIASLVEREARLEEDRPLVASVILNRLNIDMALQLDAAVQYALGYQSNQKTWWKKDLTIEDLKINSPYNTYLKTGLPPTPISNPGFSALSSVINAANTNYLYYISDKSGKNHYAQTLEQHNANIKKYGL